MVMEAVDTQEIVRLQEERNVALVTLFELPENTKVPPWDAMRWDIPEDITGKLKGYLQIELSLKASQAKAARPGFDTKADSEHLFFSNALNFLETGGEHGRGAMEKVLRRLYRVQHIREYRYAESGKAEDLGSLENQRECVHILSSEVLVARTMGSLIGKKEKDSLTYDYRMWEGYKEDKSELDALSATLDQAYSHIEFTDRDFWERSLRRQ